MLVASRFRQAPLVHRCRHLGRKRSARRGQGQTAASEKFSFGFRPMVDRRARRWKTYRRERVDIRLSGFQHVRAVSYEASAITPEQGVERGWRGLELKGRDCGCFDASYRLFVSEKGAFLPVKSFRKNSPQAPPRWRVWEPDERHRHEGLIQVPKIEMMKEKLNEGLIDRCWSSMQSLRVAVNITSQLTRLWRPSVNPRGPFTIETGERID